MARGQRPVFLERRSYRRRRMMDALRLVALLGAILWMIPMIWPDGQNPDAQPVQMSRSLFYVFGVWVILIGLAALLARMLDRSEDSETTEGAGSEGSP